jgi:hypothetical protein
VTCAIRFWLPSLSILGRRSFPWAGCGGARDAGQDGRAGRRRGLYPRSPGCRCGCRRSYGPGGCSGSNNARNGFTPTRARALVNAASLGSATSRPSSPATRRRHTCPYPNSANRHPASSRYTTTREGRSRTHRCTVPVSASTASTISNGTCWVNSPTCPRREPTRSHRNHTANGRLSQRRGSRFRGCLGVTNLYTETPPPSSQRHATPLDTGRRTLTTRHCCATNTKGDCM